MSHTDLSWLKSIAPSDRVITDYDRRHFYTYARLLDAAHEGTDWSKVAATVMKLDVAGDPQQAKDCWSSHLSRAHWLVDGGLNLVAEDMHVSSPLS